MWQAGKEGEGRWCACTVCQQALRLYSIIHSGRLGADRNKGHEIVMRQRDGGNYDDKDAAGKRSFSLSFAKKSEDDWPIQSSLSQILLNFFACTINTCASIQLHLHFLSRAVTANSIHIVQIFHLRTDLNSSVSITLSPSNASPPFSGDFSSIRKKVGLRTENGAVGGWGST